MATNRECAPLESTEEKRPRVRETINYGGDDNILIAGKWRSISFHLSFYYKNCLKQSSFQTQPDEPTGLSPLMKLLFIEKLSNRPGASQACNHLMHLIMIEALRAWYESSSTSHKGILKAYKDPRIVAALNAIHNEPEKKLAAA